MESERAKKLTGEKEGAFIRVHLCLSVVSIRSVGGCGASGGLRAGDFAIGFRAPVAIELPGGAHLVDFVQVQLSNKQLVFIAAGLRDDLPARVAEVALAVELADFPRPLVADAVDGGDEVAVGHRMRGLLELPQIFGEARDGCGRVINNLRSVESQNPRALGEVAVVANIKTHARGTGRKKRVNPNVPRGIKNFSQNRDGRPGDGGFGPFRVMAGRRA